MMRGAPTSLIEGIARYEECKAIDAQGFTCPLDDLADAYRDGFPAMERWRSLSRWGLSDPGDIDLAYMDGMAMTASIVENHGGTQAVRRLAAEYRRAAPLGYPTPAQVRAAFRRALGVSFAQIVDEAHALVWRETAE
jgi:hypothetical protein